MNTKNLIINKGYNEAKYVERNNIMQALSSDHSLPPSYPVLIEVDQENHWVASVVGWADAKGVGTTRDEAIQTLRQYLIGKQSRGELIALTVDSPQQEVHPWMEFAGMWASDPQFDEFVAEMQAQRELDLSCEDIV
ncbi:hypothetical protein DSM106972_004560 [Dulcicalothrix desertica PCC 7102]|jgi:hypothetical protein|uniref:HicB family protein n=1 Tax=Dulcicalothrix desertica PCC 7102 TaxID=232991 RepID=A0A3S1ASL8_9CYAN|nr:type II toxin-antitoxin system HicB family antitoxin [Dulcicalothrix desertica]RUT09961.1 hypothetical protein DSM106972_004560 [Dulcicalothrix desertica PCC 7102]TWH41057.1 putative RNase H-like HicB family nuclease [Dulcicalothrix desertica PCC 7102]